MIYDFGVGGLKMIDISSFSKISQNHMDKKKTITKENGKSFLIKTSQNMAVKVFFSYNLNVRDTLSTITTSDVFLKELLGIWAEVNFEPGIM